VRCPLFLIHAPAADSEHRREEASWKGSGFACCREQRGELPHFSSRPMTEDAPPEMMHLAGGYSARAVHPKMNADAVRGPHRVGSRGRLGAEGPQRRLVGAWVLGRNRACRVPPSTPSKYFFPCLPPMCPSQDDGGVRPRRETSVQCPRDRPSRPPPWRTAGCKLDPF